MPGLGPGAPSCWLIKIGDTRSCPVPNNFGEIEGSDARISSCNEKTAYRIAGAAEESSMAEGVVARVLACSGWYDGDSEACKKTENFGDFLLSDFARLRQVPGTPPPLPENLLSDCTENCPLRPCEHPGGFGIRKSASNSGHSPLRGSG